MNEDKVPIGGFEPNGSPDETTPSELLSPDIKVKVPLIGWVKQIAITAADRSAERVIKEHESRCRAEVLAKIEHINGKADENREAVNKINLSLARLIAFMLGSGALSGAIVKWLG